MLPLTHIVIGMIMAVPFALFFNNQLYIVAGAVGSFIPDIDLLPFFRHRGFMHSLWLWLVTVISFTVLFLIDSVNVGVFLIFVIMLAWIVHLLMDFLFTDVPFYDLDGKPIIAGSFIALTYKQLLFIDYFIFLPILLLFISG